MSEDSPEGISTEASAEGATERAAALDDASTEALTERLWARVLENWDDDKPHQAILEHALRTETLPSLAGKYRALEGDAERGARAKKKMDGIVAAATQMLFAMKTPPRTRTPWQWTASVAAICFFVLAWLGYRILVHR